MGREGRKGEDEREIGNGLRSWLSMQSKRISACTSHFGFRALGSVPYRFAQENMMNERHSILNQPRYLA